MTDPVITGGLDELRLHASYALGGGPDTRRAATLAYTDFLLQRPASAPSARGARVDVLRMFRNLAPSHSRQALAHIGRLVEALH